MRPQVPAITYERSFDLQATWVNDVLALLTYTRDVYPLTNGTLTKEICKIQTSLHDGENAVFLTTRHWLTPGQMVQELDFSHSDVFYS